jgi:hypothetical protein
MFPAIPVSSCEGLGMVPKPDARGFVVSLQKVNKPNP